MRHTLQYVELWQCPECHRTRPADEWDPGALGTKRCPDCDIQAKYIRLPVHTKQERDARG